MWKQERALAEELFNKAGLGEDLTVCEMPRSLTVLCRLPYMRIGTGPADVVVMAVTVLSSGPEVLISGVAYNDTTGRMLRGFEVRHSSLSAIRAVVSEMLEWRKENRHPPALA